MKTRFKYIHFKKIEVKSKTAIWSCRNNHTNSQLGMVKWYGPWRQYCYFDESMAVYNVGCLEDINEFLQSISV